MSDSLADISDSGIGQRAWGDEQEIMNYGGTVSDKYAKFTLSTFCYLRATQASLAPADSATASQLPPVATLLSSLIASRKMRCSLAQWSVSRK